MPADTQQSSPESQRPATGESESAEQSPGTLHADVVVIGWGKGPKTFAGAMAGAGKSVVMIERSAAMYGGTCINIGCVPTKALVHSADTRRDGDDPASFFAEAVKRRDALIGKLNDVNFHMLADRDEVTIIDGAARFVGPKEVEVTPSAGGRGRAEALRITGDIVIIGTGATPVIPEIDGIDPSTVGASGSRVHTSTSIQHAEPFPRRLAILGSGPIGLEFASMMRGFGADVTLIARGDALLTGEEPEVVASLAEILAGDGIDVRTGASIERVEQDDQALTLHLAGGGTLEVDGLLIATGRRPATDDLGLDAAGIDTDERGAVTVDDQLRTSVDGVWAMGDVHGGVQQTFLSLDDHRIVMSQLVGDGSRRVSDRVAVPATIFTTPPLSSVGLTEAQAREAGHEVKTVVAPVAGIKAMPRPKTLGDPRGVIKVVVDAATDEILGARLLHVDSQEVINLVALAMRAKVTASQLRDGIWTHPSSTEALNEVLAQVK